MTVTTLLFKTVRSAESSVGISDPAETRLAGA
jgi:hypothetical protein